MKTLSKVDNVPELNRIRIQIKIKLYFREKIVLDSHLLDIHRCKYAYKYVNNSVANVCISPEYWRMVTIFHE